MWRRGWRRKLQPFALSSLAFGEEMARVYIYKLSWPPRLSLTRAFTSTMEKKKQDISPYDKSRGKKKEFLMPNSIYHIVHH
jgi:hypothetical protein